MLLVASSADTNKQLKSLKKYISRLPARARRRRRGRRRVAGRGLPAGADHRKPGAHRLGDAALRRRGRPARAHRRACARSGTAAGPRRRRCHLPGHRHLGGPGVAAGRRPRRVDDRHRRHAHHPGRPARPRPRLHRFHFPGPHAGGQQGRRVAGRRIPVQVAHLVVGGAAAGRWRPQWRWSRLSWSPTSAASTRTWSAAGGTSWSSGSGDCSHDLDALPHRLARGGVPRPGAGHRARRDQDPVAAAERPARRQRPAVQPAGRAVLDQRRPVRPGRGGREVRRVGRRAHRARYPAEHQRRAGHHRGRRSRTTGTRCCPCSIGPGRRSPGRSS